MRLPLAGVRIIDLTIAFAGPAGTALLAELGAEVIKVENINARLPRGGARRPGHEQAYNRTLGGELHRSKKAIALNFATTEARSTLFDLVRVSDAIIDNFSPRVMPNFGFTYERLAKVRPDIIMVSMPAFGSTGPYANRVSFGPGIDASSGLQGLSGYPDGVPVKPGHVFSDYNTAVFGAFALMMALYTRRRTGRGQRIDLAMRESVAFTIGDLLLETELNHRAPARTGNRHRSMAPHNVYPCREADTWIAIAVEDDAAWQRLAAVIGNPDWARDERFRGVLGRWQHQDEIDKRLGEWTQTQEMHAALTVLQSANVNSGAVLNARDVANDPHYQSREFIREVETPDAGKVYWNRTGYVLSDARPVLQPAAGFAEHNDEIFRDVLGMSADEVAQLEESRATSRVPMELQR
jgi:crotonobetainyl-CoA:carnitine CoA-transferase CaiB-like acyl-CoA transferase